MSTARAYPDFSRRGIVVCPLPFERRALRRFDVDRKWELHCCGPGRQGIIRWAESVQPQQRPVVLAGLAGALQPHLSAGQAYVITEVRDGGGRAWQPSLGGRSLPSCITMTRKAVLIDSRSRQTAGQLGSADLADLESAAFAAIAATRGWHWGVVRGVSDDLNAGLPRGVDRFIDSRGRVRLATIALEVCRRPSLIGTLAHLRRVSWRAMHNVSRLIESL